MLIGVFLVLRVLRPVPERLDGTLDRRYCCIVVPQYGFKQALSRQPEEKLNCISFGGADSSAIRPNRHQGVTRACPLTHRIVPTRACAAQHPIRIGFDRAGGKWRQRRHDGWQHAA
jgi:hypothetical protein